MSGNTLAAAAGALAVVSAVEAVLLGLRAGKPKARASKRRTANTVLLVLGLFLLAFVVTMIVTFWVKGAVPDTLIQYTLGAGGVEALVLALIRISKVIAGDKPGESEGS